MAKEHFLNMNKFQDTYAILASYTIYICLYCSFTQNLHHLIENNKIHKEARKKCPPAKRENIQQNQTHK